MKPAQATVTIGYIIQRWSAPTLCSDGLPNYIIHVCKVIPFYVQDPVHQFSQTECQSMSLKMYSEFILTLRTLWQWKLCPVEQGWLWRKGSPSKMLICLHKLPTKNPINLAIHTCIYMYWYNNHFFCITRGCLASFNKFDWSTLDAWEKLE